MSDFEEAARRIGEARDILVVSHVPPDGDGLGAGLALVRTVRSRGGAAVFAAGGPIQDNLRFLVREGEVDFSEGGPDGDYDLAVSLDTGSPGRLGGVEARARACPALVVIDHHATNEPFGTVNWTEPTAPATGEMMYRLLRSLEVPLTEDLALPLYVALVTDTGRFSYSNTTPACHRMAAELLATGMDVTVATEEIYRSLPLGFLRLRALATEALTIHEAGLLASVVVTDEMVRRSGADPKDVGDLVDVPISVEGVEAAVLLRSTEEGGTKLSLRSRRWFSVSDFAAGYGGGGHHRAAGATIERPLEDVSGEVIDRLAAAVREGRP